ncbi:MAG: type II secretion system protein GspE, partial [Vicinamibacterales bacterium]
MPVRIGELLLKEKRITPAQLQEALNYQKTSGGKLGFNLVKLGFVKDEDITALLSKQYGVPSINLTQFEIDPAIVKLIPSETAHKYQIVPLSRAGATLTIAMTDPTNVFAMDDIKFMTGYNVEPVVASETAVTDAIARYYPANAPAPRIATEPKKKREVVPQQQANLNNAATLEMVTRALEETAGDIAGDDVEMLEEIEQIDVSTLEKQGGEAPVIRLVNLMLMSAI